MAAELEPSIQRALIDFIHTRIEHIRSGNRQFLDLTYCPICLNMRNEYNRHDYDWYMNLIENGFGVNFSDGFAVQAGGKPSLQMSRLPWSEEWCLVKL